LTVVAGVEIGHTYHRIVLRGYATAGVEPITHVAGAARGAVIKGSPESLAGAAALLHKSEVDGRGGPDRPRVAALGVDTATSPSARVFAALAVRSAAPRTEHAGGTGSGVGRPVPLSDATRVACITMVSGIVSVDSAPT